MEKDTEIAKAKAIQEAKEQGEREAIAVNFSTICAIAKAKSDAEEDDRKKAQAEIDAKRAADLQHRENVKSDVINAFIKAGFSDESANAAMALIVGGAIPHVRIEF